MTLSVSIKTRSVVIPPLLSFGVRVKVRSADVNIDGREPDLKSIDNSGLHQNRMSNSSPHRCHHPL